MNATSVFYRPKKGTSADIRDLYSLCQANREDHGRLSVHPTSKGRHLRFRGTQNGKPGYGVRNSGLRNEARGKELGGWAMWWNHVVESSMRLAGQLERGCANRYCLLAV